jgi:hypothetical protein
MKNIIILQITFVLSLLVPSVSNGGGSVSWEEIKEVINQDPEIAKFVYSSLDCKSSGYTDYRIGGMFPLGGRRLGPYEIRCRNKGSKTDYDLLLIVNTKYKMYDNGGNEVDIDKATRIDEKFVSIQLQTYKENCPSKP